MLLSQSRTLLIDGIGLFTLSRLTLPGVALARYGRFALLQGRVDTGILGAVLAQSASALHSRWRICLISGFLCQGFFVDLILNPGPLIDLLLLCLLDALLELLLEEAGPRRSALVIQLTIVTGSNNSAFLRQSGGREPLMPLFHR